MKLGEESSPLYYFLAGALIPTITYALFLRNKDVNNVENITFDDDDFEEDEDGSFESSSQFDPVDKLSRADPSKWGVTDAPYKVRRYWRFI